MTRRYTSKDIAALAKDGLDAQLPEPKPHKKRGNEEGAMQRALMAWWHPYSADKGIPECLLFAIPNGSALGHGKEEYQVKQRQIRGRMMKLEGLRPGCPDLMLAVPDGVCSHFHNEERVWSYKCCGLFIEMKLPNGVVSEDQTQFMYSLRGKGYRVEICRSLDEAIKTITEYLT